MIATRAVWPALAVTIALLSAAGTALADDAPRDSTLEGYVRSMADSTDRWFGLAAQPADTAGLDSARDFALAHPLVRPRVRQGFAYTPEPEFNRALGAVLGGAVTVGSPRTFGSVSGHLRHANGPNDWYGGGDYAKRWRDPQTESLWALNLWVGRSSGALDRDHFDRNFSSLYAFVSGTDRNSYLRRDGANAGLARRTARWWAGAGYRSERESPLATTATWTLFHREPVVIRNDSAAAGRASEVGLRAGLRLPRWPFTLEGQYWTAGGALGGDLAYSRLRLAGGGAVALGRHLALAPQAEYGRLTGTALPQDAFYMGGGPGLRSANANALQGTGKAVASVDLLLQDDVLALLHVPHPAAFPIQVGAFAGAASRWGFDPASGRARLTARDWPDRGEWLCEAGASLLYRPGLPSPETFVRVDYVIPIGPDDRQPRIAFSYTRALSVLNRR